MYERAPWLVRVWSTPTKEVRVVMDGSVADFAVGGGRSVPTERARADALPLRSDDTLAVFSHKLQLLLGKRVYWWASDASGAQCPYMEDGGSGREPLASTLRQADTLQDLYETHLATNVVNVMPLEVVLQLNPRLGAPLGVDPAVDVDPAAVAQAEVILSKGCATAAYTAKVGTYIVGTGCTRASAHLKTFSRAALAQPFTMLGIHTLHDTCSARVSERAIRSGDLGIEDAQAMAGHLVRRVSPHLMVATSIDGCSCETIVEGDRMQTAVKTLMPDLSAAQAAAEAALAAVHGLQKTRRAGRWVVSALHMHATFVDARAIGRSELLTALQAMETVLHSEPQYDGSVIVHLKRVPRFVAMGRELQFLELHAGMLEAELSRMLAREFGMALDDARARVEEHAQLREGQERPDGMPALDAVGAMAMLKVGNHGIHMSVRCTGDIAFAHRLMWLISRIAPGRTGTSDSQPPSSAQALRRVWQLVPSTVQPYTRQCGAVETCASPDGAMPSCTPESIQFGEGGVYYACLEEPVDKRFPGLSAVEKHPLGLRAPCCFAVMSSPARCAMKGLAPGHEGALPPEMPAWAFGNAIRVGVHQGTAPVVNAVCHALRLSRNEVVERVTALGVHRVGRIARGNLLHRFIDQTMHPHDPHVHAMYTAFARSATGRTYVARAGKPDALRDFVLWNGYHKVMQFVKRGCAVGHLVLLPLLMAALQLNIVVLERSDAGMSMHCPYGGDAVAHAAQVVLLKQGDVYEPLARVPEQTLVRLGVLAARICASAPELSLNSNEKLVASLQGKEGLIIESQVVSTSFEAVGVLASGLFIPYPSPSPCDLELPMVFESALPTSAARRWNPAKVNALFKRLARRGALVSGEIVADELDILDGTLLESLRGVARSIQLPGTTVPAQAGTCPSAWKSALAGTQLVRASGLAGLVEVVRELGGPILDSTTFARIVANEFMKTFDTGEGKRPDSAILQAMRSSHVPKQAARRAAAGTTPNAATASAVLAMCDVNVLAVDERGCVVGLHASGTDRHVVCFGQYGGGVAFVSLDGSRVHSRERLPVALAARFKSVGGGLPTLA
jgi:hypothetical protein